jgi:fumarate reductase (CoM/CoB) subunit B
MNEKNIEIDKVSIKNCSFCGMCKSVCPVFQVLLKEKISPRGKVILTKEEEIDKSFFVCTLCGACKEFCPNDISLPMIEVRRYLTLKGKNTLKNKKMLDNIRAFGNPFGEDVSKKEE